MVELQGGAATDVGRVRESNQDAYFVSPQVYVVADGMGGHQGGEVASAIVVEEFARLADDGYDIRHAPSVALACLEASQRRIQEFGDRHRAAGDPDWYAGTTVVAALLCEDDEGPKWLLVNLGDSRIYKLHEGVLDQVTVDHSLVQELLDAGEIGPGQVAGHPDRHVITRALGGSTLAQPDFFVLPLTSAARLVLCSDGVTGMIGDDALEQIVREAEDPSDAAERVVAAALAAGGEDNATAVVVDVVGLTGTGGDDDERPGPVDLEQKLGALP